MHRLVFSLLAAACSGETRRFRRDAVHGVAAVQAQLLRACLKRANGTELGRALGLKEILAETRDEDLYKAYTDAVPVRGYERIASLVDRLRGGESGLFTTDRVRILEPTSGTSGGSKLIPYTDSLRREYVRGIKPWIHHLLTESPQIRGGSWYWSLSPAGQHSDPASAIPIGFQDDAAYTGALAGLFRMLFPVPPWIKAMRDLRNFRHVTCLYLLAAGSLTMISVWSPSFLTLLLQDIRAGYEGLIQDLELGQITLPVADPVDNKLCAGRGVAIRRSRLDFIRSLHPGPSELCAGDLWTRLLLVSCWTDGPSALELPELRELLGPVAIQKKGLLATEGIFTIPLSPQGGCVPAYRSHFLEFRSLDVRKVSRVHELELEGIYELVVTTGGGLFRYCMGDVVRVTGTWRGLPLLEFRGRSGTSDLVGEKIGSEDARRILQVCGGVFLSPVRPEKGRPYYAIFHKPEWQPADPHKHRGLVEEELCRNFHYAHALRLGQLGPSRIYALIAPLVELRQAAAAQRGVRAGDVKSGALGMNAEDGLWLARHSICVSELQT